MDEDKIFGLQKIINDRAGKALEKDINEIDTLLRKKEELLGDLKVSFRINDNKVKEREVRNLFYWTGADELYSQVFNKNIDRYIEKETKKFLQEIEETKQQMYELQQELNEI